MHNPFEFGRELLPGELVDRKTELQTVARAIHNSAKLWLIGPRRFGKSSLLNSAAALAQRDSKAIVLRYDAEAFPSLEQLSERIAADTSSRLTGSLTKARAAATKFFASVSPEVSIGPDGSLAVRLAGARDRRSGVPLLADVLDAVNAAAEPVGRPVAVMIDEFQKIVAHDPTATQQLRAAIQTHRHVGYILAGSATRLLTEMTSTASEPFYRLGSTLYLGAIPRTEFAEFLSTSFAESGIASDAGAIGAILDAAQDVPYNVQLLAHACWEACRSSLEPGRNSGVRPLTRELVEATHARAATQNDPLYSQLWNSLTSAQQRALLALLNTGEIKLFSHESARLYSMSVSTMQSAVAALERRGITREESAGGISRLRLEDPLFGKWVDLTIPKPTAS
jgi:hypothetical protein